MYDGWLVGENFYDNNDNNINDNNINDNNDNDNDNINDNNNNDNNFWFVWCSVLFFSYSLSCFFVFVFLHDLFALIYQRKKRKIKNASWRECEFIVLLFLLQ